MVKTRELKIMNSHMMPSPWLAHSADESMSAWDIKTTGQTTGHEESIMAFTVHSLWRHNS